MPKTKDEIQQINAEVDRRLRTILQYLEEQGAVIEHVRLSITGKERGTDTPVDLRIERDVEDHSA
jgi:hypothetical protein